MKGSSTSLLRVAKRVERIATVLLERRTVSGPSADHGGMRVDGAGARCLERSRY